MADSMPTASAPPRAPEIDWPAIRERADFIARHQRLDRALVDAIGPGEAGENILLHFAALSDQSLDYLVTGKRPYYDDLNQATEALSDVRALTYALDRLTDHMSYKDPEQVRRDADHAIRIMVRQVWQRIEDHDHEAYGDADEAAA